jgi:hypothetical protein
MLKTVTNSINASQIQTPITLPGDVTLSTGNLVIGTSGKGIDFSATPGTGTSELLDDYEEGTWTPAGNGITFTTATGKYTKVGNLVTVTFYVAFPSTADTSVAKITGLPYVSSVYAGVALQGATIATAFVNNPTSEIQFVNNTNTAYSTNANLSTQGFFGCVSYQV